MAKFQFWLPTNLTRIQQRAVDSREPIFLSGVPGTGKTVVSIRRLQNAASLKKRAIIFTYGKLLKKTIEEKLENSIAMPVDNIHRWTWWIQDQGQKKYLKDFLDDNNLPNAIGLLKSKQLYFDEILVDEGQDFSINTYKLLREITASLSISADNAQRINNRKEATSEEEIRKLFPTLQSFELDQIFRSAYELYRFAIQFVPNNARANDPTLLERLKKENSGADRPYVYLETNRDNMYNTIRDIIDENFMDNIGILFEKIEHIDEIESELSKDYEISAYHSKKSMPSELKNIIITTFKSAKGIEFDIVIIPYIDEGLRNVPEEYYVGATRAKSQVHFIAINEIPKIISHFDKSTYRLVDNRG
ncbi:MAG: AAA family ATPase [Campylobacterales bacterium]|nr:AAA family ATPase [Campylobacterales bacterium]